MFYRKYLEENNVFIAFLKGNMFILNLISATHFLKSWVRGMFATVLQHFFVLTTKGQQLRTASEFYLIQG